MSKKILLALVLLLVGMVVPPQCVAAGETGSAVRPSTCNFIRVNQLGYLPHSSKVAVLMSREAHSPSSFRLIDAMSGEVRATLIPAAADRMDRRSGKFHTYRLDFSEVAATGSYYVDIEGIARSTIFRIAPDVYDGVADYLLEYMRQQRCGYNPFQHDSCHVNDGIVRYHPTLEGKHLDVRGGWHDAADLLQYTPTSATAIYQMCQAYRANPRAYGDRYDAAGEPGANGIPDIIDEIKWGLDWLNRMNPEPGDLYNQIADDRDHIGMKMPKDDPADYGYGKGGARPVYYVDGKPQQRGRYMNATTGAASTAGKFASSFALGAETLRPYYPEFAAVIAAKARLAYEVGIDKPGNTQTVSVVSPYIYAEDNWVDDMELAAMELYRLTDDKRYMEHALKYSEAEPVTPWMGADTACHYQWYPFLNYGHIEMARVLPGKLRDGALANMREGLERIARRGADHPFGWGVPGIWCSNNLTVAALTQCIAYRTLSGDSVTFRRMEGALRDWLFGCNPWGTSMIVGLPAGGVYPHAPHSNWVMERVGQPNGGLVDGPVYATIFRSLKGVTLNHDDLNRHGCTFDDVQPDDVVYHDNTADYSTNEPTMDGTASLMYAMAVYQREGLERAGIDRRERRNVYSHGGIVRGDPAVKAVSLVFTAHDTADGADAILNALNEARVPGSFFVTGTFVEQFPDVLKRLVGAGHYVGTHSDGHLLYAPWDRRDSCLVSHDEFVRDIREAYRKLAPYGITPATAPWFMPPYEWYNRTIASWARDLGLQVVNFTPGTGTNADYTWPGVEDFNGDRYMDNTALWTRLIEHEARHTLNGHLLIVHMGTNPLRPDKFYNELPQLLRWLGSRGYNIVSLNELLK